jgi:hypothetical protein
MRGRSGGINVVYIRLLIVSRDIYVFLTKYLKNNNRVVKSIFGGVSKIYSINRHLRSY